MIERERAAQRADAVFEVGPPLGRPVALGLDHEQPVADTGRDRDWGLEGVLDGVGDHSVGG